MAVDPQSPNGSGQIRGVLEARRRQLSEELDRLTTRIREHGSKPMLRPDSSEVDTSDLDTALVELTTAMLRGVERALERLREGRYGRCTRCGGFITESRLLALPFAQRCRPCESARERRSAARSALRKRLWDERPLAMGSSVDEV